MDKNKNGNGNEMPFVIGVGLLVGTAVVSQKQEQIKMWFYDNMMTLVLVAFVFIALIVMRFLHKMKKKEADMLARMRAAKSVKPKRSQLDYYDRNQR